ncbi:helix-turn-helix transcriptional regulator [Leuconostocaceae bacterium ESL0723]|nr:helix-turn-helix transcriptional regulator [Leuconostocaceae bacterium ESL0723]
MNRVREYRKLAGITQADLAQSVGIARQTVNLIENGKYNPSLSLCIGICHCLGTDLNTLFWEENQNENL